MKTYKITKTYNSLDEMHNSLEYKEIWEGWQGKATQMRVHGQFEFVKAIVVEVNPDENYGQPFKLYHVYKVGGSNRYNRAKTTYTSINEIQVSASLSNSGICFAKDSGDLLSIFNDNYYEFNTSAANHANENGLYIV